MANDNIVVAGVCGSGKTTLVSGLKDLGYNVHAVAQEHSYAPRMWQMTNPRVLIFLDCSLDAVCKRRKVQWGEERLVIQRQRLSHAREHCHLYIDTDNLNIDQVVRQADLFLKEFFAGGKT